MDVYTVDHQFRRQEDIDGYSSVIWTERYAGNSEAELVVPLTSYMINTIVPDVFLNTDVSQEVMVVNSVYSDQEAGTIKATAQSLLQWLNNRFVRASNDHSEQSWPVTGKTPGQLISYIVQNMCIDGPYLDGTINTGIPGPAALKLPGLYILSSDTSGPVIDYAVPYKPVYDVIKEIADAYSLGMQINLSHPTPTTYRLDFRNYLGTDRSSGQSVVPVIQFSQAMDSLADVKEFVGSDSFKTAVYAFAPQYPGPPTGPPGVHYRVDSSYTGFDLKAEQIFCDDLTTDLTGSGTTLLSVLNNRASNEILIADYAKTVDGKIAPLNQFKYNVDYFLGDIIEMQGNSGVIQTVKVTEYIYAQDEAGERAYSSMTPIPPPAGEGAPG